MPTRVRVAMAQMLVEPGALDANLARAVDMIRLASVDNCAVVVLPETLDLGWAYPEAAGRAHPVPGPVTEVLCEAARNHRITVVAGVTESSVPEPLHQRVDIPRPHNTAVLIDSQGRLRGTHRKINELPFAQLVYAPGQSLAPVDSDFGPLGIPVCADNWPGSLHLGASLAAMGARMILSPCAWAVPPGFDDIATPYGGQWLSAYQELARTHGMPVVGVSNVGPVVGGAWDGYACLGRSLAVDVDGAVLARGPAFAEALLVVTLTVGSGGSAPEPG